MIEKLSKQARQAINALRSAMASMERTWERGSDGRKVWCRVRMIAPSHCCPGEWLCTNHTPKPKWEADHGWDSMRMLTADDLDWLAAKRRAYERWLVGEGELPPSEPGDNSPEKG